jgi:alpha-mannosidase
MGYPSGQDSSVILRVYDMEGKNTEAALELLRPVQRAFRTNIVEEEAVEMKPRQGRFVLPVGHNAIETVRFDLGWH